jgi:hypothetical protein
MNKKFTLVISFILLIFTAGYFYLRFGVLKAKDFKPDNSKQKNKIDLRPSIISKLQQLVKDGSNGLYILSINDIEPDVLAATVNIKNASIKIDTAAMRRLDSLQLLPDDIFTFSFNALFIDGIGVNDLLNRGRIDVRTINILKPIIHVYHKKRSYNEAERIRKNQMSLYERLKGQMKKIAVGNISITEGTFINHDLSRNKTSKFNDVSVLINDLLIDSTTQSDSKRFLFAKTVTFNTKNYSIRTADSLYFFKAGDVSISGNQNKIILKNIELKPRLSKQQFESRLKFRKEMYSMSINKIILNDVDWQAMVTNEKFISKQAEISGGKIDIFLNRSKPAPPVIKNNFPHQLLMRLSLPISISKIDIKNLNLIYGEYNPASAQNGTLFFDNVNGELSFVSNISSEVEKHPVAIFTGSAMFMHIAPMTAKFTFDLSRHRTGDYTVDLHTSLIDNATTNLISEPLGLFNIKKGELQQVDAHVKGNNSFSNGTLAMKYSNLHITPLKKDNDQKGNFKNKSLTSFFANKFLIKDNNNGVGKDFRKPDFYVKRVNHPNFFNLTWKSILTGILKTIGIPVKLVIK